MKNIIALMTLLLGLGLSLNSFAAGDEVDETATRVSDAKGDIAALCKENGPFRKKSGEFCGISKNVAGYVLMTCGHISDFPSSGCGKAALAKLEGATAFDLGKLIISAALKKVANAGEGDHGILCRILPQNIKNMTASCPK